MGAKELDKVLKALRKEHKLKSDPRTPIEALPPNTNTPLAKRKVGRPSLCTEEITDLICKYLLTSSHITLWQAAECAGIQRARMARWMRLGRDRPGSKYGRFMVRIRETQARHAHMIQAGILKVTSDVKNSGLSTPFEKLAAARLDLDLYAKTRKEYQPRERITVTGKLKIEAKRKVESLSNEELAKELERRATEMRKLNAIPGRVRELPVRSGVPELKNDPRTMKLDGDDAETE